MTDRELLRFAAKAAGYECPDFNSVNGSAFWVPMYGFWNPLADDSDALRLAVNLGMVVEVLSDQKVVFVDALYIIELPLGDDPYAATRRAIVMAAAEIGKEM
jgi:hypothetical protein